MNKQKWTEKPITWGGYLKLCGVVYVISVIAGFVWCIASFEPAWWSSFKKKAKKLFMIWHPGRRFQRAGAAVTGGSFSFFHRGCFYEDAVPNLE